MMNLVHNIDSFISKIFLNFHVGFFDSYMPYITEVLGPGFVILLFAIVIFIVFKQKRFALLWAYVLSIAGSLAVAVFIKEIIKRPRPVGGLIDESGTYSFPSNHSTLAASAGMFFVLFILKSEINKSWKIGIISLLIVIVILTGFSRLYLGVHYFSDVIVGYLIGTICALVSIRIDKTAEGNTV